MRIFCQDLNQDFSKTLRTHPSNLLTNTKHCISLVIELCRQATERQLASLLFCVQTRTDWTGFFEIVLLFFQNAQNRITRAVHHKRRLYVPTDRDLYTILKKNRMGLDFVQFISNDLFLVLSDIICPTITSHIRQFVTSEDMKEKGYGIWR